MVPRPVRGCLDSSREAPRRRYAAAGVSSELGRYIEHVFLRNPWRAGDIGPLVYETGTGVVGGFVGIVPRPLTVEGR